MTSRHALFACAAAAVLALALSGCGPTTRTAAESPTFTVNPDAIGERYDNRDLGISLHPPVGWIIVSENQRQAVVNALASEQDDDEYSLVVVDIFFNTENLSLASLSVPTEGDGGAVSYNDYVEAFAATIGVAGPEAGDEAEPTMTPFSVNDITVTEFRHIQSERITFTLIFSSPTDTLVQLDYSIPTAAYQREGTKLESSIGTLSSIE